MAWGLTVFAANVEYKSGTMLPKLHHGGGHPELWDVAHTNALNLLFEILISEGFPPKSLSFRSR
jgi:hypothetical protein